MAARRCIGMFAKMVVSGIGREGVIPNFDRDMMGRVGKMNLMKLRQISQWLREGSSVDQQRKQMLTNDPNTMEYTQINDNDVQRNQSLSTLERYQRIQLVSPRSDVRISRRLFGRIIKFIPRNEEMHRNLLIPRHAASITEMNLVEKKKAMFVKLAMSQQPWI